MIVWDRFKYKEVLIQSSNIVLLKFLSIPLIVNLKRFTTLFANKFLNRVGHILIKVMMISFMVMGNINLRYLGLILGRDKGNDYFLDGRAPILIKNIFYQGL